jgi:PBP1b-binding outer membrane lipoprotein LpoB
MKPAAYIAGLALLAVGCTAQKKEEAAATDSAVVQAPAASVSTPPVTPTAIDSTNTSAKLPSKKPTSRGSAADSERDSATEALFVLGEDGKLHRIKR